MGVAGVPPSSYVSPGGHSMRGGAVGGRVQLLWSDPPARPAYDPRGEGGGQGWGGVTWSVLLGLDPLTPQWGEGGVGPGKPRDPRCPSPLTMNVGRGLTNVGRGH